MAWVLSNDDCAKLVPGLSCRQPVEIRVRIAGPGRWREEAGRVEVWIGGIGLRKRVLAGADLQDRRLADRGDRLESIRLVRRGRRRCTRTALISS
jgi:hypothetical protein